MEVLFFTEFSKRKKSTKQPNDKEGILKNVVLKDTTDKVNPTFILTGTDDYVYCKAWGMYYFVHRVGYNIDGAQVVYCNIDVLATWKANILATTAFVRYSSSNYNTKLIDDRVAVTVDESTRGTVKYTTLFTAQHCYMLTACNKWGGLFHYVMSEEELKTMLDSLSYDSTDNNLSNVFDGVTRQFGDAMSAIQSLVRLPIFKSVLRTGSNFVGLGAYQVPDAQGSSSWMQCDVSENGHVYEIIALDIPWQYTDFRRDRKYSTLVLQLPFIGQVELNSVDFVESDIVYVRTDVNVWTGGITYTIYSEDINRAVATYKAQCGLEMPVSSVTLGNSKAMVGLGAGATALATVGAMSHPATATLMGLNGAISAGASAVSLFNQYTATNMGSYSGTDAEYAYKDYSLTIRYYPCACEPSDLATLYGRPCMKVLSLATLNGYVETIGFSIDISSMDIFKQMINEAMDSGVYLE